jgi:hypothetical protein
MQPALNVADCTLFASFLKNADEYLEFGCGGSTYAASRAVKKAITSVESSQEWIDKVEHACLGEDCITKPAFIRADIGPTGQWGYPSDPSTRELWPSYYEAVWERPGISNTDLYFVDGRFRIACFMKILLNCRGDSVIMIHDFSSRKSYHCVREVAREIASADEMSIFIPRPGQSRERIEEILTRYKYEPS